MQVALITDLGAITEECARVAESIGISLTVLPPDSGGWQSASLILLGEDVREAPATDRADTILVVLDDDEPSSTWAKAAHLGVDQLAVLPAAAEWLSGRMIAAVEPPGAPGTTVGVVAGCGGAGASVLACALARRAGAGHSTVLVDADPLGGGLDLVLGAEAVPGPRWTDLSASRGQLRPSALADALPRHDGLALLSWGRDDTVDLDPDVFDDFLAAAGQAFDLVIVDLPRHAPPQWTRRCHHVLLVSPARVRSAVASSQVAKRLSQAHPDVRLVVRETGPGGLDAELLADSIGLSLAGSIRDDRGLSAAVDRGEGIPGGTHLGRLVDRLLGEWVE